ncbi:hypothetical protein VTL71DRAFT_16516 [Oculimacula yallundae]|uniref:Uncharacterized protein n=1 Tax=Oculimacula yallundae TaxID=86028 RepID=A0ABR4CEN5_9HELO
MALFPSRPTSATTTESPVTLPYKKTFPAAWIISTVETRGLDGDRQDLGLRRLNLPPPETPQTLVRESVLPAVLFIQQAGLASPATSASLTSLSSRKGSKISKTKKAKHRAADQTTRAAANKLNPPSEGPSVRGAMRKLLPDFLSSRSSKTEKRKGSIADVQKNLQNLPKHRGPFIWPENSQKIVSNSPHNMAGLESVPEESQVKLTEESLGWAGGSSASPYEGAVMRRIRGSYSDEPATAGTGISSRSSNYADVTSRLPQFSPGYSPMARSLVDY